jgi:acyl carrier protein
MNNYEIIRNFIASNTYKDIRSLNENTLIFKEGLFDSMGFIMLIDFIEQQFGIKTSDEDLIEKNFESIKAISSFIDSKLKYK